LILELTIPPHYIAILPSLLYAKIILSKVLLKAD